MLERGMWGGGGARSHTTVPSIRLQDTSRMPLRRGLICTERALLSRKEKEGRELEASLRRGTRMVLVRSRGARTVWTVLVSHATNHEARLPVLSSGFRCSAMATSSLFGLEKRRGS